MRAPVRQLLTIELIAEAVIERYLGDHAPKPVGENHRMGSTVKDIAVYLGRSESSVRKVIDDARGFVPGCSSSREVIYGATRAYVYYPNLWKLREMIRELRTRLVVGPHLANAEVSS